MPDFRFESTVPVEPSEVFAWHERPGAVERLTPPWETLRVLGRRGPFARWVHTHRFLPAEGGGCLVRDEVDWQPPLGPAGELLGRPIVQRELGRMFAFRHRRLAHDLEIHARHASRPRLKVAVTGAGGLIGRALCAVLSTGGHEVVPIVRDRQRAAAGGGVFWDPPSGVVDTEGLRGCDALVHLAGEPIGALRWTEEKKKAIRESRVQSTGLIARSVASLHDGPSTLVVASAVGYYGGRGEEILTEDSGPGKGFLARTCVEWEASTRRAEGAGLRVVKVRSGLVVSPRGGALPRVLTAFRAGLGGRIGHGRQYVPWIDLDDCVGVFVHALMDESVRGPVNATGPHPIPNSTFTDVLGRVLRRPTVLPVPRFAVRAMLGEMGEELLLRGQRARPARIQAAGYRFRHQSFESSLRHQLGREEG